MAQRYGNISGEFKSKIKDGTYFALVAPHKLGPTFIRDMVRSITDQGLSVIVCSGEEDISFDRGDVVILTVPAILCEMYTLFGDAYVGGGFGRSVHSLLEPILAGCRTFSGPKTFRSTEFDLALEIDSKRMIVLDTPESFSKSWKKREISVESSSGSNSEIKRVFIDKFFGAQNVK